MSIHYLFIVSLSCLAGLFFIPLSKKFVLKYRILSSQGVPLAGGINIGASFFLACSLAIIFYNSLFRETAGILISSFIMFVFGVVDDKRELSVFAKFLVQIIAASVLVFFGVKTQIIYIGTLLNLIITFFWVLGISNAFNHLDVMDGLSAGVALVVSFGLFLICIFSADIKMAMLLLALIGSLISFLFYNLPPAKIYMGNSGSHFLGFILASVALAISYAPLERKVALLSPLLILGFPIFDTLFLMLMRLKKRKLPFKKSNDHVALRLLKKGYSKAGTLILALSLCMFFVLCGIALSRVSNLAGAVIIAFAILISIALTVKISKMQIDG